MELSQRSRMIEDYWSKATIAVIGGGSWGTVLAHLAAKNCAEVRIWVRQEDMARAINSSRANPRYVPELSLSGKIRAMSDIDRVFEREVQGIIWALPSSACRVMAREFASRLRGDEVILHATKGIEEGSLKRPSEMLREEFPSPRIGVISGPNLAAEVARNEPAATVVASVFDEVVEAGQAILSSDRFRVYSATDVIGVEWAGTLKNVLAIASGALDELKLGWNTRAMLLTRGLAEMVRFGVAMGAQQATFLGLAGMGDLLATCSSPLSRNYRVGQRLARGQKLAQVLAELGSTAEGVRTTKIVWEFARSRGIEMPITEGVYQVIHEGLSVQETLHRLMTRPQTSDNPIQP